MFKRKTDLLTIWEVSLLLALSLSLCLGTWAQGRQSGLSGKLVRLHVIAASDEEAEQALKLRVRDAVLEYLSPRLIGASESDQAQAILRQELEGIRQAAESATPPSAMRALLCRRGNTSPSASPWERARAITGGALCSRRCASPPARATR